MGYETARLGVPAGGQLDVALAPVVATLGEAVVTAGNPAENVMRRVIARKARWRAGLETWRAEAYSRQTIRAGGEVVGVIEAQTLAFWDRDRGTREVVQGVNRTGNFDAVPLDLFTAADQTLNLYDDEIPFGGFDLMGPTSPRALGFYRFEIVGTRALGTELVYDLSFEPRSRLQPGFRGTLSVLVDADAMIAVSAGLSDAVQFPVVRQFELRFDQQFSPFGLDVGGEAVWLPADFRMDGRGKAGTALIRLPDIGFAVASRFTDYAVNVAVPDSLYRQEGAVVDSARVARALPVAGVVPLSAEEERALVDVDSTLSLTEAFRPRGPLARFFPVSISVAGESGNRPRPRGLRFSRSFGARYNRVEGAVATAFGTARLGRDLGHARPRLRDRAGGRDRVARRGHAAGGAHRSSAPRSTATSPRSAGRPGSTAGPTRSRRWSPAKTTSTTSGGRAARPGSGGGDRRRPTRTPRPGWPSTTTTWCRSRPSSRWWATCPRRTSCRPPTASRARACSYGSGTGSRAHRSG